EARKAVTDAAVLAAKAVNYVGAGTVEFIADASEGLRGDRIWFMEMNTRLQVEHPVTEEITGQDLVEWQLRVASGEKLPLKQEELKINGWAMEARLYAENPETGFLPSTGVLSHLRWPRGDVRIDTGVDAESEISPNYDPMIAKLIVHADSRSAAIAKLSDACGDTEIWPVKCNAGFLRRCLRDADFAVGHVDTNLIAAKGDSLLARPKPGDATIAEAAFCFVTEPVSHWWITGDMPALSPWRRAEGFRLNAPPRSIVRMRVDGNAVQATPRQGAEKDHFIVRGDRVIVFNHGDVYEFTLDTGEAEGGELAAGDGAILSPMPGKIVSVAAKAGANLKKGDPILVLEAMKMEHTLTAPFDGKLAELNAKPGAQVSEGVLLAKLEKE
ncbi:MAG: methylcrotonoyl-CoA carboxylase, partial [Hyphomonadaceae bacterium]|nr:methylcrotonoyl-CoA carboxylase [Hyphomonadaceae bacterium]